MSEVPLYRSALDAFLAGRAWPPCDNFGGKEPINLLQVRQLPLLSTYYICKLTLFVNLLCVSTCSVIVLLCAFASLCLLTPRCLTPPLYRGTSLIRNRLPLWPDSRPMPRALWWSWGVEGVLV